MSDILSVGNLSKKFADKVVLDSVCFELHQQKIYALVGANGSGKTTLFNILNGFLRADSGEMRLRNRPITNLHPYQINRLGIGRTFQDLRVITKLTVKENILLSMTGNPSDKWLRALLPQRLNRSTDVALDRIAESIAREYYLQDVDSHLAGEVSYGQQKLLTLACCVANDAELLLLDEPAASISSAYGQRIAMLLKDLKQQGKTILLIEHNSQFIEAVADQVIFLNQGSMRFYDTYDSLSSDPSVLDSYR